jgi:hypothetical protein
MPPMTSNMMTVGFLSSDHAEKAGRSSKYTAASRDESESRKVTGWERPHLHVTRGARPVGNWRAVWARPDSGTRAPVDEHGNAVSFCVVN